MFVLVAVVLFVAFEFVLGWWALPVVGLILGLVGARRKGVVPIVAAAATTAWVALFAWNAIYGNLGSFMHALAGSMKLPFSVLLSATAFLPVALAGAAARLGAGLRPEMQAGTPSNG